MTDAQPAHRPSIALGHHLDPWGEPRLCGLPMADLTHHTVVVGTTGSGKSTLLRNLAMQFWKQGGTVVVLEPSGDLILGAEEGLLAALAADPDPDGLRRLVLLDFAGPEPPQLNLATEGLRRDRAVAVELALDCIRVVEEANWTGALRMRAILRNTLHLLLALKGREASLLDVDIFLTEPLLRDHLLRETLQGYPGLHESRRFWEQLLASLATSRKETYEEVVQHPLFRLGDFLQNPFLRRTLSLPPIHPDGALDLGALLDGDEARMILLPIQASRMGPQTREVYGTLLLQAITDVFLARGDEPGRSRRPVMVIVDEFPALAGTKVGAIVETLLREVRKFNVSVVLATQGLHQLPHQVREEIRDNASNKVVLRLAGADDAQVVVRDLGLPQLSAHDLLHLPPYHGYARLVVERQVQDPFSFRALPPWQPLAPASGPLPTARPLPPFEHPALEALQAMHRLVGDSPDAEPALHALLALSDAGFRELVDCQQAWQIHEAERLLTDPEADPELLRRARAIGSARYGLPWWLREAQVRRLRRAAAAEVEAIRKATAERARAASRKQGGKQRPPHGTKPSREKVHPQADA
jgi:energy-coupling factor transporter ATP-binding protein EcfA2